MKICGDMRNNYHPANHALVVVNATSEPTATETNLRFQRPNEIQDLRGREARTYRKLLDCSYVLPDPVAKIIYKGIRVGRRKEDNCKTVTEIAPKCPILLPTCCEYHQCQVHQVVTEHKQYLYNSPEPPRNLERKVKDRLEQIVDDNVVQHRRSQFPLTTVCVRWKPPHVYALYKIHEVMREFGKIDCIQLLGEHHAAIIYSNLADSCKAVSAKMIGRLETRLYCHWMHRSMGSRTFYSTGKRFKAVNNEFINPSK